MNFFYPKGVPPLYFYPYSISRCGHCTVGRTCRARGSSINLCGTAAGPSTIVEGGQSPQLDERVVVGEEDIAGVHQDMAGIAAEVRPSLDELGGEDPEDHDVELGPFIGKMKPHDAQEVVPEDGEVDHAGDVDGVDRVRLGGPGAGGQERARVGAEGGTGPAERRGEVLGEPAEGRLDLAVLVRLDADAKALLKDPAGDEVVIVRTEGTPDHTHETNGLVEVTVAEFGVANNVGADGAGATRDGKETTVDLGRGHDLKVVAGEVQGSDHVPEELESTVGLLDSDTLVGTNKSNVGVLEGGEKGREEAIVKRPDDVIIDADGDVGIDDGDDVINLNTLSGLGRCLYTDVDLGEADTETSADLLGVIDEIVTTNDDEEVAGSLVADRLAAFAEDVARGLDGWADDGDMLSSVPGDGLSGSGAVEPVSDNVDKEAPVTEGEESCKGGNWTNWDGNVRTVPVVKTELPGERMAKIKVREGKCAECENHCEGRQGHGRESETPSHLDGCSYLDPLVVLLL